MKEDEILRMVKRAQDGDDRAREQILRRLRDFTAQVAGNVCHRSLSWQDDELAIAWEALDEAIDSYEPERASSFKSFAGLVIRRRLIDHFRSQEERENVSLQDRPGSRGEEEWETHPAEAREAERRHEMTLERWERAQEINLWKQQLAEFDLDFTALEKEAPQREPARERLRRVAKTLAEDPEMVSFLLRRRQLPLSKLSTRVGVSRKTIERGRKFVIALCLLMIGQEFESLRDFFDLPAVGNGDEGHG